MRVKWYPTSAAPRDGTPVMLWIEDTQSPPAYPVTVGLGPSTTSQVRAIGRSLGGAIAHTTTSISIPAAGSTCRFPAIAPLELRIVIVVIPCRLEGLFQVNLSR
jgi:hypothetical protein